MYVYYFNGKDNDVHVSKVLKSEKIPIFKRNLLKAYLDSNGDIKKDWVKVPETEGEIFKRSFWLSDYDIEKADQIIDDYKKERYLYYLNQADKSKA